jgi:type I restriction enzyme S subunit
MNGNFDFPENRNFILQLMDKIDVLIDKDKTGSSPFDKFHVQGRVYEYFLGYTTSKNSGKKTGSQIEDLGQYYTSKNVIRYCMAKVNPSCKNDKVPTMGDFFCGSGGFITEYIRFLNHKYKNKIDWSNNVKNLFGCDTDRDIIKSALVDVLLITNSFKEFLKYTTAGENTMKNNIKRINSTFDDDFNEDEEIKVMYNFTNPPYGGDKGKSKNDKVNLNDATNSIKHIAKTGSINIEIKKDTQPYIIKGDNKETIALLHGMSVLEKNGIYCGVLKEGVFFDKKFKDLRKNLINNYDVKFVVSVPQSEFWNTSTKTSILIFKNSGKRTSKVNFCELKETTKDNVIEEINPQTNKKISEFITDEYKFIETEENYLSVDYEEIKENDYSLNCKNYIKQDIKVNEDFKVVKLGDVFKYLEKSKRKAGDSDETGMYKFYTSSDTIKKSNFIDYTNNLCLIFGTGGKCSLFLDKNFSCSADNFICITNNELLTTYIYYYLKLNWNDFLKKLLNGSTIGHISKERLNNYEIPIPKDISTLQIYLDYLNPANESLQSLQSLQSLKQQKERAICGLIKMLTSFGKDGVEWDEFFLKDICSFNINDKIKYQKIKQEDFIEYLDISNCFDFTTQKLKNDNLPSRAKRTVNINDIIMSSVNLNLKNINIITKNNYVNNLIVSTGFIVLQPININSYYLYFYLLRDDITNYLINKSTGSIYPSVTVTAIENMKIRILKPHIIKKYNLEGEFEFMDKLRNDISQTLKNQEEITKQMMKLVLNQGKNEKDEKDEKEETEETEEIENISNKSINKKEKQIKVVKVKNETTNEEEELAKLEKELEEQMIINSKKGNIKIV